MNGFKSYTAYLRLKLENLFKNIFYGLKNNVKDRKRRTVEENGFSEIISDGENITTKSYYKSRKNFTTMNKFISLCITLTLIVFLLFFFFIFKDQVSLTDKEDIYFLVNKNTATYTVAKNLYKQKIIRHPFFLKAYVKISGNNEVHAGTFKLKRNMNIPEIMNILSEKSGPAEMIQFTVPEGLSLIEIKEILIDKKLVSSKEFDNYIKNASIGTLSFKYSFIDTLPQKIIEGYLYPDTYKVSYGSSINDIIETMVSNFNKKIYKYYKSNFDKTPLVKGKMLSFHEIITLASIIEKEAVVESERELIAGVFINRLNKRMYLGSCPTVKYAMGDPKKPVLYFKDLDYKSPFNTYRNLGLPPGPIASPGFKSFKAVLNAKQTDYLYFIAKGDGTHHFSKSQKEHDNMRIKLGYN